MRVPLQVLEMHVFHSFLRDRQDRKMDSFAQLELRTRSEMQNSVIELLYKNSDPFYTSAFFLSHVS